MNTYRTGIDIGSTTVKLVVLDDNDNILYGDYRRHQAHTQQTLAALLSEASEVLGDCALRPAITGSGSINLGRALDIPFVQEVVAVASALEQRYPQTDVAIELGGEDAKIIYFTGGLEERMNGVCAGGTGSFIDQMAALLQTDAKGLNDAAADYQELYTIAARCGVFAKTDIQPLINEGATRADLAASIFQAVVNQTISGLACGKPIRGCVAFLGGPLHFLPELKKAFIRTLKLTPENIVDPDNSHLFAAMGAALETEAGTAARPIGELIDRLAQGVTMAFEIKRLPPLFADKAEYDAFCARHAHAVVAKADLDTYEGDCFLGIDAGSTTTKLALTGAEGELLWSYYANNSGSPIRTAMDAMAQLARLLPPTARIAHSCSTGYGEALLKAAFHLDEGEVETIAHTTAAAFFDPQVDCVLDIGGQDMKCIRLKNGTVDSVMLNEACSSGCGSFLENFANSLGFTAAQFADEALFAQHPVDLGTRCTVFMNSNVKQAQKEGAAVSDISAGLAYSVIKNALFKVIKLRDFDEIGKYCVVQGGTFMSDATLRAFELLTGRDVIRPDVAGCMGAYGAALLARDRAGQTGTSGLLSREKIDNLQVKHTNVHCGRCSNNCLLTINDFGEGHRFITGNRCEKGAGAGKRSKSDAPNLFEYKNKLLFDRPVLSEEEATRGTVGIPRALNMYENYPFWHTFLTKLGFSVVLSPKSSRNIYSLGIESIPSESECYPAKISHGHVMWLLKNGIKSIFYPCVPYEMNETPEANNHYNCPIVASYAENIKNNMEELKADDITFIRPFVALDNEEALVKRMYREMSKYYDVTMDEIGSAIHAAYAEAEKVKEDVRAKGEETLRYIDEHDMLGIVLAGRPYHLDPEINHGLPELINSYKIAVFTEDSVAHLGKVERPLIVSDQWMYHSRLYKAANYVKTCDNLELIQLNSFGCGLDAVTTDCVNDILTKSGKIYTVLKIDEVSNLGAARIRIRSLISAVNSRHEQHYKTCPSSSAINRIEFTKEMKKDYTVLAPQMSPIHFDLLAPAFKCMGINIEILPDATKETIDVGLKYVNNDACYPSLIVVGQMMSAITSGKYDVNKLAVIMSQTGGGCRATNYVGFIRRALSKAGYGQIPVIALSAQGFEKNSGFKISYKVVKRAMQALIYGDVFMRCLYRTRPYEKEKGSANALHEKWKKVCLESLTKTGSNAVFKKNIQGIVHDFDTLPLLDIKKPRVGIVGEILVKFLPSANNHLVDLLEAEGAEAVMPDLLDFFMYCFYNNNYNYEFLGKTKKGAIVSNTVIKVLESFRKPARDALEKSKRFEAPAHIEKLAAYARPIVSIGNQNGEGWFLTGEMIELIKSGAPNIVCAQPFACLPNHIVGKGVIKHLREAYPEANIVAVDYDPGASEVNQVNRIKLMLAAANKNMKK